jgi:hypothetical protein
MLHSWGESKPDTTKIWSLHNSELFFKANWRGKEPHSHLLNIKRKENLYENQENRKKLQVLLDPLSSLSKCLDFILWITLRVLWRTQLGKLPLLSNIIEDPIVSSCPNSPHQHYRRSNCFFLSKFTTSLGWWYPHRTEILLSAFQ